MKCKNKEVSVKGMEYNDLTRRLSVTKLRVIVTNDEKGKSISIDNGAIQFSIPFEPIEEYLKGDYKK